MARRKVDLVYTEDHVTIPLSVIIGAVIAVVLTVAGGFGAWMWFLHQRTDEIPVINVRLENIEKSQERIEQWAGTLPPKQDKVAAH